MIKKSDDYSNYLFIFKLSIILKEMSALGLSLEGEKRFVEFIDTSEILKAVELVENITFEDQSDIYKNVLLGILYQKLGKTDAALRKLKTATSHGDKVFICWFSLGDLLRTHGLAGDALYCFQKAIEINQESVECLFLISKMAFSLSKRKLAEDAIQLAVKFDPKNGNLRGQYAKVLMLSNKDTEAVEQLKLALTYNPRDTLAVWHLSKISDSTIDEFLLKTCHKLLEDATVVGLDRARLHFVLHDIYFRRKYYDASYEHLEKGNTLKRNLTPYNATQDNILYQNIKRNFGNLQAIRENISIQKRTGKVPIFIVGMPRSGTSLLERMLGNHSSITALGELTFVQFFGSKLSSGSISANCDEILKFRNRYLDAVEVYQYSSQYFIDKMPHNFLHLGLISIAFPEAKLLYIKRDKLSVCWSNYTKLFNSNNLAYSYDLIDTKKQYEYHEDIMAFWQENLDSKILNIDYQELIKAPEICLKNILAYLELDYDQTCLQLEKSTGVTQTASFKQVREKLQSAPQKNWIHYAHLIPKNLFE